MIPLTLTFALLGSGLLGNGFAGALEDAKHGNGQEALGSGIDGERYKTACPDYKHYSVVPQYVQDLAYSILQSRLIWAPVDP